MNAKYLFAPLQHLLFPLSLSVRLPASVLLLVPEGTAVRVEYSGPSVTDEAVGLVVLLLDLVLSVVRELLPFFAHCFRFCLPNEHRILFSFSSYF